MTTVNLKIFLFSCLRQLSVLSPSFVIYATGMTRSQRVFHEQIEKYRTSMGEPDRLDDVHRGLSLRPPEGHSV